MGSMEIQLVYVCMSMIVQYNSISISIMDLYHYIYLFILQFVYYNVDIIIAHIIHIHIIIISNLYPHTHTHCITLNTMQQQPQYYINKHNYRIRVDSLDWQQVDAHVPDIPHHHVYTFMPASEEIIYYRRLLYYLYNDDIGVGGGVKGEVGVKGKEQIDRDKDKDKEKDKQEKQQQNKPQKLQHQHQLQQPKQHKPKPKHTHTHHGYHRYNSKQAQHTRTRILQLTAYLLCMNLNNYYAMMLRNQTRASLFHYLKHNNYNNQLYYKQYGNAIKEELYFINCLLNRNPKEYQLWNAKKDIINSIQEAEAEEGEYQAQGQAQAQGYDGQHDGYDGQGYDDSQQQSIAKDKQMRQMKQSIRRQQDNFIFHLMTNDDEKNYHAWDYKTWMARHFKRVEQAIIQTDAMLFMAITGTMGNGGMDNSNNTNSSNRQGQGQNQTNTNNNNNTNIDNTNIDNTNIDNGIVYDSLWKDCYSCWSYRFNLILDLPQPQLRAKYIRQDTDTVLAYVLKNPQSQCAWNYLTGLLELDIYNNNDNDKDISSKDISNKDKDKQEQDNKDQTKDKDIIIDKDNNRVYDKEYAQQKQKIVKLIYSICSTVKQQNRHAWGLLLHLSQDKQIRREALHRLKAIDAVRAMYYDYLDTNNYV